MKKPAIRKFQIAIIVLAVLAALVLSFAGTGKSRSIDAGGKLQNGAGALFDGAVIKWIVPNNPGGGFDDYSRLIAPYLEKYTGARVDIRNMPGAGGMRGTSELFRSPADGLTIALLNGSGLVTNRIAGISDAAYEISDLSFICRVVNDTRVLALSAQSQYSSFTDILQAENEVTIGATGLGGSTYVDAVIIQEVFGLNMKLIHGFDNSSGMRHAMLRGSIDGAWSSFGSSRDAIASGQVRLVLQNGLTRAVSLPDTPTVLEFLDNSTDPVRAESQLAAWEALNSIGRIIVAPPGMHPDTLEFLRNAIARALHDPQFIEDSANAGRPLLYAPGEELEAITTRAKNMSSEIQQHFVEAVRSGLR